VRMDLDFEGGWGQRLLGLLVPGALVRMDLDFEGGWGVGGGLLGFCGRKSRADGVFRGIWLAGRVGMLGRGRTRLRIWADVRVSSEV